MSLKSEDFQNPNRRLFDSIKIIEMWSYNTNFVEIIEKYLKKGIRRAAAKQYTKTAIKGAKAK